MKIPFVKMHGAANDFVMIDDRDGEFSKSFLKAKIVALAARRTGVGSEGVILVQRSDKADFRMRFYNPDGGEAEMCGNGARCVAVFALAIGAAKSAKMSFETLAGIVSAEVLDSGLVKVALPEPSDYRVDYINTGVPHKIVKVDNVETVDVEREGRAIRYSKEFAPAGTNVDFIEVKSVHDLAIRTYERGVEGESGACGTGATAAALIGIAQYGMVSPIRVNTKLGFDLIISALQANGRFREVTLTGPVEKVFSGEFEFSP